MIESTTTIFYGVIACASTLVLILAPAPFSWRIYKKKTTEQFHPWPYLATQINCLSWFMYYMYVFGSEPCNVFHSWCYLWAGSMVVFVETCYIANFWYFTTQNNQVNLGCILIFEFFIIQFWVAANKSSFIDVNPSYFLGSTSVVSGIFMYGSSLFDIINAYRTKSSKCIPSILCLAMFLSSLSWFICAFTSRNFDPYIAITYGIGTLLGLVQLGLLYKLPDMSTVASIVYVNCVEATLDVNDEIMVLSTYCGMCNFHAFELEEKIKINPSARYLLSKDEQGESWTVQAALTTTNRCETREEL